MPRQKTGRPLGRPALYSADERPVTVSLRIPHDLAAQLKRYASLHRQSVTELLLDGLKWRLGELEYYGNTETSTEGLGESDHTAALHEIRAMLVSQGTQLTTLTQALTQRPVVSPPGTYYSNTAKEPSAQQSPPQPEHEASNTVLQQSHATPPRTEEPAAAPVETVSAVPRPAPDTSAIVPPHPRRGRPPGAMRQHILTFLETHAEGMTAEGIRAALSLEPGQSIGDTLQGMRRRGVVTTQGRGPGMRYFAPQKAPPASPLHTGCVPGVGCA